uniref:Kunitz trypsin inhibitor n=1 Tax=Glycine soja TaxID=3848 RepID=A9CSJ1_GLYSO|nr:Kunitz trypsin inhibitor [Glycine soja]
MKSTIFFALFLFCAFTTSYLPSAIADFVLDNEGNPLENGGTYYILSDITAFGGIRAAPTGNERCPLTVVQSRNELDKGIGTIISSPYRIRFIAEGHPLSLKFDSFAVIMLCVGIPTEWSVVEDLPEGPAVKIGENKDAVDGWFRLERVSDDEFNNYKLVFCPQQAEDDKCGDIGISIDHDDGTRRLVVSKNKPLVVQFQKLDKESLAKKNHGLSRSE